MDTIKNTCGAIVNMHFTRLVFFLLIGTMFFSLVSGASIIQSRRDTPTNWTSANPVLAQGEIGLELTTLKFKFGDGTTAWTGLAYAGGSGGGGGGSVYTGIAPIVIDNDLNTISFDNTSSRYITVPQADANYQVKGNYVTKTLLDGNLALYQLVGNYITKTMLDGNLLPYITIVQADVNYPRKSDVNSWGDLRYYSLNNSSRFISIPQADANYQAKGNYVTKVLLDGNLANYTTTLLSDTNYVKYLGGITLPSVSGNSGKYLTTNGTIMSWATVVGGGGGKTYSGVAPIVIDNDLNTISFDNSSTNYVSKTNLDGNLALYQLVGNYVTKTMLDGNLLSYITILQADANYQVKGNYVTKTLLDGNLLLYVLKTDYNTFWDARNSTNGGSGYDSNTETAGLTNASGKWLIDLNTTGNLKADGNYLCDLTTCYLISDLNAVGVGSATPAGSNTQIQFNDSGVFGADANFKFDSTNDRLTIGNSSGTSNLNLGGTFNFNGIAMSVAGSNALTAAGATANFQNGLSASAAGATFTIGYWKVIQTNGNSIWQNLTGSNDQNMQMMGVIKFHGTSSSFPALKDSGGVLKVIKADGSGDANFTAGGGEFSQRVNVNGGDGNVSVWGLYNASFPGYITRTPFYDKNVRGSALNQIHDAEYYLTNGKIDHNKFGDSRIVTTRRVVDKVITTTRDVVQESKVSEFKLKDGTLISKATAEGLDKSLYVEDLVDANVLTQVTDENIVYKTVTEDGVLLDDRIAIMEQAIFELNQKHESYKNLMNTCINDSKDLSEIKTCINK